MLLDQDRSGSIDLDEFVSGCLQLHGPAKSMQMAKMSFENKRLALYIGKGFNKDRSQHDGTNGYQKHGKYWTSLETKRTFDSGGSLVCMYTHTHHTHTSGSVYSLVKMSEHDIVDYTLSTVSAAQG